MNVRRSSTTSTPNAVVRSPLSTASRRSTTTSVSYRAVGQSPACSIISLGAERFWFQHVLAGEVDVSEPSGTDPRGRYRQQITRSDRIVESFALDAGPNGTVPHNMADEITSTRDIMLHMIEETARHAGHLDIARELLDGQT